MMLLDRYAGAQEACGLLPVMVLIGELPEGSAKRPSYGFLPGVPGKRREPPGERIGEPGDLDGERWGDPGDRLGVCGAGDAFAGVAATGDASAPGRP
jgi:hypothetical protein